MAYLKLYGIQTATHYLSLCQSAYYKNKYKGPVPVNCERFVDCLLCLPLFYTLRPEQVLEVIGKVVGFYDAKGRG